MNPKPRNLNTIVHSPIIFIHTQCSALALASTTNSNFLLLSYTLFCMFSLACLPFFYGIFMIFLFQITMPKCHKIYPSCIEQVLPDWHGLNYVSALLTKVYWNYATHIVRVCVSSKPLSISYFTLTKVIFKFISVLKLRLVYTNFFDNTLFHVLSSCSKNCSSIFRPDFLHTSSIILLLKSLIMNQFVLLTLQFPHFFSDDSNCFS